MASIRTVHDSIGSRLTDIGLSLAGSTLKGAGKLALSLGRTGVKAGILGTELLGRGAISTTSLIGKTAINLGYFGGKTVYKSLQYDDFRNPIGKTLKAGYKFTTGLAKYNPKETVYNVTKHKLETRGGNFSLTKKGKVAVAGIGLIGAGMNLASASDKNSMGMTDSRITTATPIYQQPTQNKRNIDFGGATGDLVFALHNNR